MFLLHCPIIGDVKWTTHVAHWSSVRHCGIHFVYTFLFPRCLVRMWNILVVDIPTSAAIGLHIMLWFSLSMAWLFSMCLLSVIVTGMPLQVATSASSCPRQIAFIHGWAISCNGALCSRAHNSFMTFSQEEVTFYQNVAIHTQEMCLQLLFVHCSAGSVRTHNYPPLPIPVSDCPVV